MQAIPFGLIRVPTPGVPVQIWTDATLNVVMIMVRTVPGFTGKTYFGIAGMNKSGSNMQGVIRVLSEPCIGPQDGEILPPAGRGQGNVLRASDYWVDADIANEGVIVTCFLA
jgi:hypothetical protein